MQIVGPVREGVEHAFQLIKF